MKIIHHWSEAMLEWIFRRLLIFTDQIPFETATKNQQKICNKSYFTHFLKIPSSCFVWPWSEKWSCKKLQKHAVMLIVCSSYSGFFSLDMKIELESFHSCSPICDRKISNQSKSSMKFQNKTGTSKNELKRNQPMNP